MGLVSPIEIAVFYNRLDWLTLYLEKYNLIGNVVSNEGQHVFTFALSNCDSEIIQLLLNKGSLKQYIKNNNDESCYDMDTIFAYIFYSTCQGIKGFNLEFSSDKQIVYTFLHYF